MINWLAADVTRKLPWATQSCTTDCGLKHSPLMATRGPESHTQLCTYWPNTMKHNDERVIATVTWACDTSQCWWRLCWNAGFHFYLFLCNSVPGGDVVLLKLAFIVSVLLVCLQFSQQLLSWILWNLLNLGVDWHHFLFCGIKYWAVLLVPHLHVTKTEIQ